MSRLRPKARAVISSIALSLLLSSPSALRFEGYADAEPDARESSSAPRPESARYKINPAESRFVVRAFAGGFLSAFAHDHTIAIRDFGGDAAFTYGSVEPASLELIIKAASLEVTDKVSASDKQKIEGTMRDEVLEVSKYPEIRFKSTAVNATKSGEGQYQARISGDVTLHGVTKPATLNAVLEFGDRMLRAKGAFAVKQTTFGLKPVSVAGGTIKVKDELKFTFDVVARP